MKLLKADTLEIHEFVDVNIAPPYAILSHRWGKEECTYQTMGTELARSRAGYRKIELCCKQATQDGIAWAWVDSCCIDKTSSAELSEAINSMFRWYGSAQVCYAFLDDITSVDELSISRWFTRGFTLQELVAPKQVVFFSALWTRIGTKVSLRDQISDITRIDRGILVSGNISAATVAERMEWAAGRQTTRKEDEAYCLLGIFGVNMPLLYGEGEKAFQRLQQEILKSTRDYSFFAWGLPQSIWHNEVYAAEHFSPLSPRHGLLAASPSLFTWTNRMRGIVQWSKLRQPLDPVAKMGGIEVTLPVVHRPDFMLAALPFVPEKNRSHYICLVLRKEDDESYSRTDQLVMAEHPHNGDGNDDQWTVERILVAAFESSYHRPLINYVDISACAKSVNWPFEVDSVSCLDHAKRVWVDEYGSEHDCNDKSDDETNFNFDGISLQDVRAGPFAVVFLRKSKTNLSKQQMKWVHRYCKTGPFPRDAEVEHISEPNHEQLFALVLSLQQSDGRFTFDVTGYTIPCMSDREASVLIRRITSSCTGTDEFSHMMQSEELPDATSSVENDRLRDTRGSLSLLIEKYNATFEIKPKEPKSEQPQLDEVLEQRESGIKGVVYAKAIKLEAHFTTERRDVVDTKAVLNFAIRQEDSERRFLRKGTGIEWFVSKKRRIRILHAYGADSFRLPMRPETKALSGRKRRRSAA